MVDMRNFIEDMTALLLFRSGVWSYPHAIGIWACLAGIVLLGFLAHFLEIPGELK